MFRVTVTLYDPICPAPYWLHFLLFSALSILIHHIDNLKEMLLLIAASKEYSSNRVE